MAYQRGRDRDGHRRSGAGTLIQCVGNPLRGDDGAGPALAACLRRLNLPEGTEIREYWGEGTELMQAWVGRGSAVLIDAASSGAPPGTIHRLDARSQSMPTGLCYHGTHRFGPAEAVELARVLGGLPDTILVYAIEGRDFSQGEGLSPEVRGALETLCAEIVKRLYHMPIE